MYYSYCKAKCFKFLRGKGLRNAKPNKLLSIFLNCSNLWWKLPTRECVFKYCFFKLQITTRFKGGSKLLEKKSLLKY